MAYGGGYENDQSHSGVFEEHVHSLVEALLRRGVARRRILEVGCGSGYFLRRLCRDGQNSGVGYDPACRGATDDPASGVRFVADYYRGEPQHEPAEVVISRHVIEHVPAPRAFLRLLRSACVEGSRLFLETPAVEWILENNILQDFFYEHCSYFAEETLRSTAEAEGFHVERVTRVFGGQYLWLDGIAGAMRPRRLATSERWTALAEAARRYGLEAEQRLTRLKRRLETLRASGAVALWGAGAKGVTLANLADPELLLVDSLVDINPKKQGRFVPGTGHAIVAPGALRDREIRHVVVMNPNYEAEVTATARTVDPRIQVHVCDEL
jgi:SAM-dependent methyltransferase